MILWSSKDAVLRWMEEYIGEKIPDDPNRQALGYEKDGKIVSGVSYDRFTGHDIEMCFITTEPVVKGFAKAMFTYPFNQLGCRRITAEVWEGNSKMLSIMERVGFRKEGLKRDARPEGNCIVFGMTKSECKFL